jgi:hypothetical protein
VSLVSINAWRLTGDTLDITCNFLYCNHQVLRDILITLYMSIHTDVCVCVCVCGMHRAPLLVLPLRDGHWAGQ